MVKKATLRGVESAQVAVRQSFVISDVMMKRGSVSVILWPAIKVRGQNDTLVKVYCYVLSIK